MFHDQGHEYDHVTSEVNGCLFPGQRPSFDCHPCIVMIMHLVPMRKRKMREPCNVETTTISLASRILHLLKEISDFDRTISVEDLSLGSWIKYLY